MEQNAIHSDNDVSHRWPERLTVLDVRAVANVVLDQADRENIAITNMALNKIVYFVHCDHLSERKEPLVRAKIEAWQHGPVFRELYHEFKTWGDLPISSRATKIDPNTGNIVEARVHFGDDELDYIRKIINRYIRFSAAQLRAMSHIDGGPWHKVWGHDGKANPGMRITDEIIKNNYHSGARQ